MGSDYEKTLLGALLSPSCLVPQDKSPYFTDPSKKSVQELEKKFRNDSQGTSDYHYVISCLVYHSSQC